MLSQKEFIVYWYFLILGVSIILAGVHLGHRKLAAESHAEKSAMARREAWRTERLQAAEARQREAEARQVAIDTLPARARGALEKQAGEHPGWLDTLSAAEVRLLEVKFPG